MAILQVALTILLLNPVTWIADQQNFLVIEAPEVPYQVGVARVNRRDEQEVALD